MKVQYYLKSMVQGRSFSVAGPFATHRDAYHEMVNRVSEACLRSKFEIRLTCDFCCCYQPQQYNPQVMGEIFYYISTNNII